VVRTLDPDLVPVGRVSGERVDDALLRAGRGTGQRLWVAAVLGPAEVPGDVRGQEFARLPRVPGDEREERGVAVERGGRVRQADVEPVELAELEPRGPVVRSAPVGVGTRVVLARLPVADLQQPLADVRRCAVGPADDDRYHATASAGRGRIPVDSGHRTASAGARHAGSALPRYGSNR